MRARFAMSILANSGIKAIVVGESNKYLYFQKYNSYRRQALRCFLILKKSQKNDLDSVCVF